MGFFFFPLFPFHPHLCNQASCKFFVQLQSVCFSWKRFWPNCSCEPSSSGAAQDTQQPGCGSSDSVLFQKYFFKAYDITKKKRDALNKKGFAQRLDIAKSSSVQIHHTFHSQELVGPSCTPIKTGIKSSRITHSPRVSPSQPTGQVSALFLRQGKVISKAEHNSHQDV